MNDDEDAVRLGTRVRAIRATNGQSLAEVARGTGLTESFLSRLERGKTGVTVSTLRQISTFFGLQIVDLLERESSPSPLVTRAGDGPALVADAHGRLKASAETLISRVGATLQATLYRSHESGGRFEPFSHQGEEFVYVLAGSVVYFVGERTFELSEGDTIWHSSLDPHRWEATSRDAVTLHINTPPTW